MKKLNGFCHVLATVTLCAACSSGDSKSPPERPVDFGVESTVPSNGLRDVGRSGPFVIRFSDEVDPASVRLVLTPGADVALMRSGTSNREFTYEAAALLAPRTDYAASVEAVSAGGLRFASPYVFRFTTGDEPRTESERAPAVALLPADGSSNVGLSPKLTFSFNAPMDRESVEAALRVEPSAGCASVAWGSEGTTFECAVAGPLAPSTSYEVVLGEAARRAGGAALGRQFRSTFTTRPRPGVVGFSPEDGAIVPSVDGKVAISFKVWPTSMDEASLKKAFRFVSPPGHAVAGATCFFDTCMIVADKPFAERETVTWELSAEARDGDGVAIAAAASGSFKTARRSAVVLKADPLLDGTIAGGLVDVAGARLTVGRGAQAASRALLSFDLAPLPPQMIAFSGANLYLKHDKTVGAPSGMGSLLAYSVTYGALTAVAFDAPPHTYETCNALLQCRQEPFDASFLDEGASWSAFVSDLVQRDLEAGAGKSQFRIKYQNDAVTGAVDSETFFSANDAANAPTLEVRYWEP